MDMSIYLNILNGVIWTFGGGVALPAGRRVLPFVDTFVAGAVFGTRYVPVADRIGKAASASPVVVDVRQLPAPLRS